MADDTLEDINQSIRSVQYWLEYYQNKYDEGDIFTSEDEINLANLYTAYDELHRRTVALMNQSNPASTTLMFSH